MLVVFTSCVTSTHVRIDSDVTGAAVYLDNRPVGTTPVTVKLSNAIWKEYRVLLVADGYRGRYARLKKEIKAINLIAGLFLFWPALLWVQGPEPYQHFHLLEEG